LRKHFVSRQFVVNHGAMILILFVNMIPDRINLLGLAVIYNQIYWFIEAILIANCRDRFKRNYWTPLFPVVVDSGAAKNIKNIYLINGWSKVQDSKVPLQV